jgi:tetratricopeptide (TPR) repeat protein
LLLVAVLWLTFFPLLRADYINLDDAEHYYNNSLVLSRAPDAVAKIFLSPDTTLRTYAPLSIWSFHVESLFSKFDPFVAHAVNFFLHLLVVILVVLLGRKFGFSAMASFLGGTIFAFHPMHVESFAWVTERKDLLYSIFYVLALMFYCDYLDKKDGRYYVLALLCAGLSIMSKAMALSLPLMVILLDWFKRRKFSLAAVLDKIPFLLVVGPIALITFILNVRQPEQLNAGSLLIWIWTATFYVKTFFVPLGISSFYAIPVPMYWLDIQYLSALVLACAGTVLLWVLRRYRLLIFSVLFYVLSTFFLWRLDVWDYSAVSNRFMYLPSVGFCFLLAVMIEFFIQRYRYAIGFFVLFLFLAVVVYDHQLALTWVNCSRYWDAAIAHNPRISVLYRQRAECLIRGEFQYACQRSQEACVPAYFERQKLTEDELRLVKKHQPGLRAVMALSDLRRALRVEPNDYKALALAGDIMLDIGSYPKAYFFLDRVTKVVPSKPEVWFNRAMYFAQVGEWRKAVEDLNRALMLNPSFFEAYLKRAVLRVKLLEFEPALQDALKLIEIAPNDRVSYDLAAEICMRSGRSDHARKLLDQKKRLFPN